MRARIEAWAEFIYSVVERARPTFPDGVEDRDADVWEALLAVADAAGGDWPQRARSAASAMVASSKHNTPSLGVRLLADLRQVFGHAEHMSTDSLLKALQSIEEAPWGDLRGKPLDARGMALRLKPYGIGSKQIRVGKELTLKGYERADMVDAWLRYLSLSPIAPETSETAKQEGVNVSDVSDVSDVSAPSSDRETSRPESDGEAF